MKVFEKPSCLHIQIVHNPSIRVIYGSCEVAEVVICDFGSGTEYTDASVGHVVYFGGKKLSRTLAWASSIIAQILFVFSYEVD